MVIAQLPIGSRNLGHRRHRWSSCMGRTKPIVRSGAAPPNGPTDGSVVNHVGFVVQNVQESVARWKAAGVPVSPGTNGRPDQAFVNTPDGLRIEILEDKTQSAPIRHDVDISEAVFPAIAPK